MLLIRTPKLFHASAEQRRNWQIAGGGDGVHWPSIDEDISTEGLLSGDHGPIRARSAALSTVFVSSWRKMPTCGSGMSAALRVDGRPIGESSLPISQKKMLIPLGRVTPKPLKWRLSPFDSHSKCSDCGTDEPLSSSPDLKLPNVGRRSSVKPAGAEIAA